MHVCVLAKVNVYIMLTFVCSDCVWMHVMAGPVTRPKYILNDCSDKISSKVNIKGFIVVTYPYIFFTLWYYIYCGHVFCSIDFSFIVK